MEKRNLVGRRYEDFINNGIYINLTDEEQVWRAVYGDPRYRPVIERRMAQRRKNEMPERETAEMYRQECSFAFPDLLSDDSSMDLF